LRPTLELASVHARAHSESEGRSDPQLNNQSLSIRWAKDYDLAAMLGPRRQRLQFAPIARRSPVH